MISMTPDNLKEILGDLDEGTLAAIQASSANLQEVIDAKAIADGKSDIVGQGEQPISGPVKQVLTILSGHGQ